MNSTDTPGTGPTIENLRDALRRFSAARDWDQFHTPKNLALALAGETGELVQHFRWLTPEESAALPAAEQAAVAAEIADVLMFLVRLADRLDIDPIAASYAKLAENERRYPVDRARGTALRHDQLP
jgi:NTP pyrophosphatase (non-canonical NTP hydrolase)